MRRQPFKQKFLSKVAHRGAANPEGRAFVHRMPRAILHGILARTSLMCGTRPNLLYITCRQLRQERAYDVNHVSAAILSRARSSALVDGLSILATISPG